MLRRPPEPTAVTGQVPRADPEFHTDADIPSVRPVVEHTEGTYPVAPVVVTQAQNTLNGVN